MNENYQQFLQLKEDLNQKKKEKYSDRTLKIYEQLQEAVGRTEYEHSWSYLESVMNYIEQNEFCTDKQCEIVERILEHPDMADDEEVPFKI